MIENDIKEIKQNLKEMDSVLSLLVKEIQSIKEKVDIIDVNMGDTSSSLSDMIDGSLGNLSELLKTEEMGGIGDIVGKRDLLKNITEMLEIYKPKK